MRVLHVISDENIGGAGVLLVNLLRHFDKARVDSVVALPRGSRLCERLWGKGAEICELKHPCDRVSPAAVRELSRLIREKGIDLVHANAALAARIAGRCCGVRVVHTRHCCYPPSGVWASPAMRVLGGVCNRSLSDRVIATADAAAEDLADLGIPEGKIEVILNGSDAVREVSEDELRIWRERWRIGEADFVVGICARLETCKGHETFLRMAESLCRRGGSFRFLIVGDGSRRAALEDMARRLDISDRVTFTGFVSDMAPVYRLLRVNVNCSQGTETSCLSLSEGMSAGVPAVVSDYGGNAAMIGRSCAGIVVPVGDSEAFADAVWRIAKNPALEGEMCAAAHARYLSHYTADAMSARVTALYEGLVQQK